MSLRIINPFYATRFRQARPKPQAEPYRPVYARLEDLLRRWHKPFLSEPQSVHDELDDMRQQIEARLRQPTLL